jgi:hypothetical protein
VAFGGKFSGFALVVELSAFSAQRSAPEMTLSEGITVPHCRSQACPPDRRRSQLRLHLHQKERAQLPTFYYQGHHTVSSIPTLLHSQTTVAPRMSQVALFQFRCSNDQVKTLPLFRFTQHLGTSHLSLQIISRSSLICPLRSTHVGTSSPHDSAVP